MNITIPVVTNTSYDLSKFNFRFKDIYFVELGSRKLKNYIYSFSKNQIVKQENYRFFEVIISEKMYAAKKILRDYKKKI
jgi:hypothetical protein